MSSLGLKLAWPPSVAKGRYCSPSRYKPASPNPVPAAMTAWLPTASGTPGCKVSRSSSPSAGRPQAVASKSLSNTHDLKPNSIFKSLASILQGKFVVWATPLNTGPAIPKAARSVTSECRRKSPSSSPKLGVIPALIALFPFCTQLVAIHNNNGKAGLRTPDITTQYSNRI